MNLHRGMDALLVHDEHRMKKNCDISTKGPGQNLSTRQRLHKSAATRLINSERVGPKC